MLSVPAGPSACWQLPAELTPAGGASIIPEPSRRGRRAGGGRPPRPLGAHAQPMCGSMRPQPVRWKGHARCARARGLPAVLARAPSLASVSPSEWSTPGRKHSSTSRGHNEARSPDTCGCPRLPTRGPWGPAGTHSSGDCAEAGDAAQDPDQRGQWASGVPPGRGAPGWGGPSRGFGTHLSLLTFFGEGRAC